jgi:hypothetical protein
VVGLSRYIYHQLLLLHHRFAACLAILCDWLPSHGPKNPQRRRRQR